MTDAMRWWWAHWKSTTLRALGSDMTFPRCISAFSSLALLLALLTPDEAMARKGALLLHFIYRTDLIFAGFVLLDLAGLLWRIYDPIERKRWSLIINVHGFWLVFVLFVSVIAGFGFFTLSSSYVLACLFVRFWLIVRAGNGPSEVGS